MIFSQTEKARNRGVALGQSKSWLQPDWNALFHRAVNKWMPANLTVKETGPNLLHGDVRDW